MQLANCMEGVEIFEPDWSDIGANLDAYIDAWK
ncbi:2-aminoethylphosphonate ABC transporter substrate-binding protein [Streptomyces californicus]